jgi:hypothetical protein
MCRSPPPRLAAFFPFSLCKPDQSRQTFKPKLDIAKQFGREILRPQLALAQNFPFFRRRVRPTIPAHDSPLLHRLFRGRFQNLPLAERQILSANDNPKPPRLQSILKPISPRFP